MYHLIGHPQSRTMRVAWALEELHLPYEWQPAPPRSDAVTLHNPTGKVPVLMVDEEPLTDSVAIVTFLADRHGALTHAHGTLERARQDALTNYIVAEVDAALWLAAKHSFVLPEGERVPEVKATAKAEFARALDHLVAMKNEKPYLAGEDFTVPDLILGHCAGWAVAARFPLPEGAFGHWLGELRKRPALHAALRRAAEITAG